MKQRELPDFSQEISGRARIPTQTDQLQRPHYESLNCSIDPHNKALPELSSLFILVAEMYLFIQQMYFENLLCQALF